jgi:hypothetical protein
MGGTDMSNNYEAIIRELAEKRTMDKHEQEEAVRKEKNRKAAVERAVLAPVSAVLNTLREEGPYGRSTGLGGKIYLFDKTSDVDYQVLGNICWEISTRDGYAAFTDKMIVTTYKSTTGGSGGVCVSFYGKNLYGSDLPTPYQIEHYEVATDAIPLIMSKIADMIRHR